MCLGPASWAREGRASSPGAGPAPAPLAHANQPGSASGRAARWAPPRSLPGGPQPPPAAPEALESPARGSPLPAPLPGPPSLSTATPSTTRPSPPPAAPVGKAGSPLGEWLARARTGPWGSGGILSGLQVRGTAPRVALEGLQGPIWTGLCLPAGLGERGA